MDCTQRLDKQDASPSLIRLSACKNFLGFSGAPATSVLQRMPLSYHAPQLPPAVLVLAGWHRGELCSGEDAAEASALVWQHREEL